MHPPPIEEMRMPSKDKKGYETKLTLTQETKESPVQFQMEWSPPLQEFAKEGEDIPATHALMQNIFMNTLLPLTDEEVAKVEVTQTKH